MDEVQFFEKVLALVELEFSDINWTLNVDDGILADDRGKTYGLRSLWLTAKSKAHFFDTVESLIVYHMRSIIDSMNVDLDSLTREDVVDSLLPLLSIPERTPDLDFFDTTAGGLRKCLVIDRQNSMNYVRADRLMKWELSSVEAFQIAERNLAARSADLEMETAERRPGQPLLIGFHDGYDAARITVKECRQQLAKKLGPWFWVAIPARDYLFACSANISRRTNRALCREVEVAFGCLPYPLSPEVFAVSVDEFPCTQPPKTPWWRRILG